MQEQKSVLVQGQSRTRSYLVNADGSVYRRNRRHLRKLPSNAPGDGLNTPDSDEATQDSNTILVTPDPDVATRLPPTTTPEARDNALTTRSGRVSKPPIRYGFEHLQKGDVTSGSEP